MRIGTILGLGLLLCAELLADAGVLIPNEQAQPDPRVLSLAEMNIDVKIDNGVARVRIQQIFASHRSAISEGLWVFALPTGATVSDFAVWDDIQRIPGVILERRRAREIYNELRARSVDPGLLEVGDRSADVDGDEVRRASVFSARVTPIPGYGNKRVELEYQQRIAVENLRSQFSLPLRPDAYQLQRAGRLSIRFEMISAHPIRDFRVASGEYLGRVTREDGAGVSFVAEGTDVSLSEDFAVEWSYAQRDSPTLQVLTYRDPSEPRPHLTAGKSALPETPYGHFEASTLLHSRGVEAPAASTAAGPPMPAAARPARSVVVLFDSSLSMQWEKLDRSYQALEQLLFDLHPQDRFSVLVFNDEVTALGQVPLAATASGIDATLASLRAAPLRGGTNFDLAFLEATKQFPDAAATIVVLSDLGSTRGSIRNGPMIESYRRHLAERPESLRPKTYVFAVGDDANTSLLRMLEEEGAVVEHVRSTEPIEFKLAAFLSKIGREPLREISLSVAPAAAVDAVYPLQQNAFAGSRATWVGRYADEAMDIKFEVETPLGSPSVTIDLPAEATEHERLPRSWARARVDALLSKIEREGEDEDSIDEIIHWSKKFKFVTPYTSFLAAPRSLLRPRVIRPGDPILRVKTDQSIESVAAVFPFGLVKRLRFLEDEDIWQTRFLAPVDMPDGEHEVRLVLRDREGHVFRERKTFLIASKPPVVRVKLDRNRVRAGETILLRASANSSTRTLIARMYGSPAVNLRWDDQHKYNVGRLTIPAQLPPGKYALKFIAEDFAHNIGVEEVSLEVAP